MQEYIQPRSVMSRHAGESQKSMTTRRYSALTTEEKMAGVCIVNNRRTSTTVECYLRGQLHFHEVIDSGRLNISSAVAKSFQIPLNTAEILIDKAGSALASLVDPTEILAVPNHHLNSLLGSEISRYQLVVILEKQLASIFSQVQAAVTSNDANLLLGGGLVIIGSMAKIQNIIELGEEIFHIPARVSLATSKADNSGRIN